MTRTLTMTEPVFEKPLPAPSKVRPATFFVVTYLLSWLIWIPLVLSRFAVVPFSVAGDTGVLISFAGVLMPSISALVLTAFREGLPGIRRLLEPIKQWKVGWVWWGAAGLVQPVLLLLTALAYKAFGFQPTITSEPVTSIISLVINIIFLLLATTGEEIGWRGLALPALQQRMSALKASIILGLSSVIWHVPYWLLQSSFTQYGVGYLLLNFVFGLPLTFYITWFYNHGRFSLLLPIVFHFTFNIVNVALLPVTSSIGAFAILIALEWMMAILLLRHLEPKVQPVGNLKSV